MSRVPKMDGCGNLSGREPHVGTEDHTMDKPERQDKPARQTRISRPAGVGLQLLGAVVTLLGIGVMFGGDGLTFAGFVSGGLVLALGVWLFRLGRRPVTMRRSD